MDTAKRTVTELLESVDVRIDGDRRWDLQVHNEALYGRVLSGGSLALGESYMDAWWDAEAPDELIARILAGDLQKRIRPSVGLLLFGLRAVIFNRQRKRRAFNIGERHYDLGNDLYELMLDQGMNYSCGYWKNTDNLNAAQEAKLDLICRKVGLERGMRVLDIGCGWGGFARRAAERYGAEVVGVTVSREQADLARRRCAGLPVEIRLQDYRDLGSGDERFDRIVSIGMIEHVGCKNYRGYMEIAARNLKPDGIFLLHTIGTNISERTGDRWTDRYIFPDGMLPSISQLGDAIEGLFRMEDWHNFGTDYDRTLLAWHRNFTEGWSRIADRYGERFYRMWRYYLLSSAASFRTRRNQLWQVILTPLASTQSYESIRP